MQNNVNSNISWLWGTYFYKFGQNIKIFTILCTKYMAGSEVMTSSTHSFAYSYRLVKKCFVKICETSKCHNFLIFQPIFIRFSLLWLNMFTLSSEIKLNLLWSSSLNILDPPLLCPPPLSLIPALQLARQKKIWFEDNWAAFSYL